MKLEDLRLAIYSKIDTNLKKNFKGGTKTNCSDIDFLNLNDSDVNLLQSCLEMNNMLLFGEVIYEKINNLSDKKIQDYYRK